jgi:hypothetical protein
VGSRGRTARRGPASPLHPGHPRPLTGGQVCGAWHRFDAVQWTGRCSPVRIPEGARWASGLWGAGGPAEQLWPRSRARFTFPHGAQVRPKRRPGAPFGRLAWWRPTVTPKSEAPTDVQQRVQQPPWTSSHLGGPIRTNLSSNMGISRTTTWTTDPRAGVQILLGAPLLSIRQTRPHARGPSRRSSHDRPPQLQEPLHPAIVL